MMDDATHRMVRHKLKSAAEIAALVGGRPRARKVIMCHGTFDVVHPGHVRHLLYAKSKGDILIASLTADAHILKANFRPFVPQELRAFNLAALEAVDYVVIDPQPTPIDNIRLIEPDMFAKGYEYTRGELHPRTAEEKAAVEAYGGELIFTPGDIVVRSPSTEVKAPSPSRMKRNADWLWRWAGATSPGTTICTPANSEVVTFDWPRNPGFSKTSTRRSASLAVISLPASVM